LWGGRPRLRGSSRTRPLGVRVSIRAWADELSLRQRSGGVPAARPLRMRASGRLHAQVDIIADYGKPKSLDSKAFAGMEHGDRRLVMCANVLSWWAVKAYLTTHSR